MIIQRPKRLPISEEEKSIIVSMYNDYNTIEKIAAKINRHPNSIYRILNKIRNEDK